MVVYYVESLELGKSDSSDLSGLPAWSSQATRRMQLLEHNSDPGESLSTPLRMYFGYLYVIVVVVKASAASDHLTFGNW